MRTFLQTSLALGLALLVVACGGDAAGTYKLDSKTIEEAILAGATKDPQWDKMPEAMRSKVLEGIKEQAAQMSMSLELKDDGTFVVNGAFGEEPMSAVGTYKIDGETITVTTNEKDGKAKDEPETVEGKIKDGTITLRPEKDMPFDLVLIKQ